MRELVNGIDKDGAESDVEDAMQRLIDEFGTRLDESLIQAIASDYDIPESYNAIRNLLLPLADSALAEEATGFDPSGLSSLPDLVGLHFDDTDGTTPLSQSSETALTVPNSDSSDGLQVLRFTDDVDLSEDDKIASLRMIFPNFKDHTIKFVLKQAGADIERAFDELLNRQFLEENGELAKGVGAFYVPDRETTRRKAERLTRQKTRAAKLEVDYGVTLHLPDVDELEGEKGPVKLQPRSGAQSPKTALQPIPVGPSRPRTPRVQRPDGYSGQQDQRSTAPTPARKGWQVVTKKKRSIKPATDVPGMVVEPPASFNAQTAAALYRKGASNPLYRQAVGVYAERIREDVRLAKDAASVSYCQLVDDQSTPLKTDLHGVPVLDGVRIAKDRVQRWWDALDEEARERRTAAHGFTVVTGVGYHSSGGFSRLRQAVGAALKNDGWKVQVLTGEFFITGRT